MGLEVVELILRIEEEFEIEIRDEDCSDISTCGDLCSLVEREAGVFNLEGRCASQSAFYQARRDLIDITGVSRRQIRPRTQLHDLIPVNKRRDYWEELRQRLEVKLPDLERPRVIATPLAYWLGFSILSLPITIMMGNWSIAVGSPFLCFMAYQMTRPLALQPPANYATVGDLALRTAALSPKVPVRDVWPTLQKLIADELSVPLEKVTKHADLVCDLGVG